MFNMECCTLQQIIIWFYASKNLSKVTYSLIDLLKIRVYSVHFKLLLLILCPNILIRYIKVSLFSGGGLQIEIFQAGDAGKGKGWQFCIFLGDRQKKGAQFFWEGLRPSQQLRFRLSGVVVPQNIKSFMKTRLAAYVKKSQNVSAVVAITLWWQLFRIFRLRSENRNLSMMIKIAIP